MGNKAEGMISLLCKAGVGLHLGYCAQFWTLHLKGDVVELEKLQRATEIILIE